jgi:ATP-binding protein involved in chromosome partitioning
MSDATQGQVLERLAKVKGPDLESNIVALGLVSGVVVDGGQVTFCITVPAERLRQLEPLRLAAERAVMKLDGIEMVAAVLTPAFASQSTAAQSPVVRSSPDPLPGASEVQFVSPTEGIGPVGIKNIVAVASGKGGVGKSTTAVNLALSLRALGHTVGILDADIYGPSLPRLLGISDRPTGNDIVLNPIAAYGIKIMSMGFLVEEEEPMMWRGPMVISAITQMLREVAWGELDILIVDMPPGTGDAQLTMAQQVQLAGAVIVSTPQDIALIDARKGMTMFRKVEVPILGLVENMSIFVCPNCGERCAIFGHGGARAEAERLGIPFLGEVPLHTDIRTFSDSGTPVAVAAPDGPHGRVYLEIATNLMARLDAPRKDGRAPKIIVE